MLGMVMIRLKQPHAFSRCLHIVVLLFYNKLGISLGKTHQHITKYYSVK